MPKFHRRATNCVKPITSCLEPGIKLPMYVAVSINEVLTWVSNWQKCKVIRRMASVRKVNKYTRCVHF